MVDNLEERLIMEVPGKVLSHISKQKQLKVGGRIEEYAKALTLNPEWEQESKMLVQQYQYAGKTSIILHAPTCFKWKESFRTIESVINFLRNKFGEGLFCTGIAIELSSKPKLFRADIEEERLILAFSLLGTETRYMENFTVVKRRPQMVYYVMIHKDSMIIESRIPINKKKIFQRAFLETFDILDEQEQDEWYIYSDLTEVEIKNLRDIINCQLKGANHKMAEGIFDSIEVKANTDVEDLLEEDEYQEMFNGNPIMSANFYVEVQNSFGYNDKISFKIVKEGIQFLTSNSEESINYVVQNVIKVRQDILDLVSK